MQDHRTAGLGERNCSGEPRQLSPCATLSKEAAREGDPGSEGKGGRLGWGCRRRGFLTGMLPLGAGLGPEGSPGAQLVYSRGSCSTHWKFL